MQIDRFISYALNNSCLDFKASRNVRSKLIGIFLIRHVVDRDIASFGGELLDHESTQASME